MRDVQSADLDITTGIPGDDQMASFQNATLQGTPDHLVEFSVATFVGVPADVAAQGEDVVVEHLASVLGERAGNGVRFEVQVGPA